MMKIVSAFSPKGYGFNFMLRNVLESLLLKRLALLNILQNRPLEFVLTS